MRWLEAVERRLGFLAFPGLFRYVTLLVVLVFGLQLVNPEVVNYLSFDRDAVFRGEVWRLVTFPMVTSMAVGNGMLSALFLVFAVMISFLISDALESHWGPLRTTLYLLATWLGLAVAMAVSGVHDPLAGGYIYLSMFLAFATKEPRIRFMLMFLIPVEVRWLGWLTFVMMVLSCVMDASLVWLVVPALLPYGLWVLPEVWKNKRGLAVAAVRRHHFQKASIDERDAFHRCAVCGRTEKDDGDLEFRVTEEGKEYCVDHLP